jgi:peroxiredoxin (alkyl hydroperoxide reductase subunit C)
MDTIHDEDCECDSCNYECNCEMGNLLKVGKMAPIFEQTQSYYRGTFKKVSLSDYKGKWLVLFFYPRDFTFICPTEIQEFGKYYKDFQGHNCEILAASTDSEFSHKAWFESDERLKDVVYPIIADTNHDLAFEYGVLDEDGSAQRGTFIIDPEGKLQYMLISAGSVGRNIPETLRVVEALQTGELCPVNWKEGEKTLGKA